MFLKKKLIIFVVAMIAILEYLTNVLTNVATNTLPDGWKPYLWVSWPLIGICFLAIIGLKKWTDSTTQSDTSAGASSDSPMQKTARAAASEKPATRLTYTVKGFGAQPSQVQPTPGTTLGSDTDVALPLSLDDIDTDKGQEVHEPLPVKPPLVKEPSKQKIILLPVMETMIKNTVDLPKKPGMLYWSPDGNSIACMFREHAPLLIKENDKLEMLSTPGTVQALCWSPDSRMLAVSTEGEIHLWDITKLECLQQLHVSAQSIYGLDWSIHGQLAMWVDHQIQLFMPPDFKSPRVLPMQHLHCTRTGLLRWSPDGSLLVAGATNDRGTLICWHVDAQTSQVLSAQPQALSLAWHPKTSRLVVAFSNKLVIWDADKNQQIKTVENLPVAARTLSISPKEQVIIASIGSSLLLGHIDEEPFPSLRCPGQWIALWSPVGSQFATLDARQETTLVILQSPKLIDVSIPAAH